MDLFDILNKTAPIVAAAITVIGAIFAAIFAARGIGRRYKQEHAIDIATKRLAFWDSYLKVAVSTIASDETRKSAIEQEVFAGIQQSRRDVDSQLTQLSWRLLVQQKRLAAKSLDRFHAIAVGVLRFFGGLILALAIYFLCLVLITTQKHPAPLSALFIVGVILIALITTAAFLVDKSLQIKYKRDEPIIDKL